MVFYDKVLGGLAGAMIGDAMGAATEVMTRAEISDRFGGWVTDFLPPPSDRPYSGGRSAAQITDDSSQMVCLMDAIVRHAGNITPDVGADALIDWSKDEELFRRFAGPTTRRAISKLRADVPPLLAGRAFEGPLGGVSNGAVMKIAPAGWLNPGNLQQAAYDAMTITTATHGTRIAYSAAAAVACATARACQADATVYDVVDACYEGIQIARAQMDRTVADRPAPSLERRIDLAISVALSAHSVEGAVERLGDLIGNGLHVCETVPCAIGLLVAAKGDPMAAIIGAVNMGDDSDTLACVVGSITGTLAPNRIPMNTRQQIEQANAVDLKAIVRPFTLLALERGKGVHD